jgi:hypothetical protein
MAQGLVDEHTEDYGFQLVEDRHSNQAVDDVPYDPRGRRHAVPQHPQVGARAMAPLILSRYTLV